MPTYQYQCKKCNVIFDKIVDFSQRNNVDCQCGEQATRRFVTTNDPIHVTERGNEWTGQSTGRNINKIMEDRGRRDYIENEAPRIREECGAAEVDQTCVKKDGFKTTLDEK